MHVMRTLRKVPRAVIVATALVGLGGWGGKPVDASTVTVNEAPCRVLGPTHMGNAPFLSGAVAIDAHNLYAVDQLETPWRPGAVLYSGIRVYREQDINGLQHPKPIRTIFIPRQHQYALPLAIDGSGNVYVVDRSREAIDVFGPSASGHALPIRMIGGLYSRFKNLSDLAIDRSGSLYILESEPLAWRPRGSVLVFVRGAWDNETATSAIGGGNTNLQTVSGLALDTAGELAVSGGGDMSAYYVNVYPSGAKGDMRPARRIAAAYKPTLNDLIHSQDPSWIKANGLEGEVDSSYPDPETLTYEPRNNTKLNFPRRLTYDSGGNLWVANFGVFRVTEFAPNSNGDADPLLVLQGDKTRLVEPAGIAVDSEGDVFVSNYGTGDVNEYCGLARRSKIPAGSIGQVGPLQ